MSKNVQLGRDGAGDYALVYSDTDELRWVWLKGRPAFYNVSNGFEDVEKYFEQLYPHITTIEQAHRCIPYL